jgi:glycerophosphoryl diester phosphodiesterase
MAVLMSCLAENRLTAEGIPPLHHSHAHNDYEHERPLVDALELGFVSIEADIFLVDDQLLVAHHQRDTSPERTLESLYLQPLFQRFQDNGCILADDCSLTLLVDIKSSAEATYAVLARQLVRYADMLSVTKDDQLQQRSVTVIVSGNRPLESIASSNPRYASVDGRLEDLNQSKPSSLYPLISDNWRLHFRYRGQGEMPQAERDKLREVVGQAKAQGKRLRFWATPESPDLWQELLDAGVDLIGTDQLTRLHDWLRSQPKR